MDSPALTFVAPEPDQLTILRHNREPMTWKIKDNGNITFYKDCIGYESQILIRSFIEGNASNTQKDVIPPLTLTMECCKS